MLLIFIFSSETTAESLCMVLKAYVVNSIRIDYLLFTFRLKKKRALVTVPFL